VITTRRTRAWASESGTTTVVQFRNDQIPMVWLHANLGWMPIGNTPKDEAAAEKFAEEIADSYGLVEVDEKEAEWYAGWIEYEEDECV